VLLRLMTGECQLLDPSVSSKAIEDHDYCLLIRWYFSWQCGRHKATNT
jgi:hypothetical protein